jgi:hypothetical protein
MPELITEADLGPWEIACNCGHVFLVPERLLPAPGIVESVGCPDCLRRYEFKHDGQRLTDYWLEESEVED